MTTVTTSSGEVPALLTNTKNKSTLDSIDPKTETVQPTSTYIRTTQGSPKLEQTVTLDKPKDTEDGAKLSVSSQSSVQSLASSSQTSSDLALLVDMATDLHQGTSPKYLSALVKRARTVLEEDILHDENIKELIESLTNALVKLRSESNHYKIKSELLSISSKDADMRYEVENELIKREVDRLKNQGSNSDYLMNKINHQKQTLKKYKTEIINKNKEIIKLRLSRPGQSYDDTPSFSRSSTVIKSSANRKRKKMSVTADDSQSTSANHGLDTLGLLASQVLTEEEKMTRSFPS